MSARESVSTIDAHQHFWDPAAPWHEWPGIDLPALRGPYLDEHLAPELARSGVAGTILVQAQPNAAETDWMLDLAERTPWVLGVVGWVDVKAPDAAARIGELAARTKLSGVRPMLQDLSPDWILDAAARPALDALASHDLALDALVRPAHLPAIAALADRHPDLTIVIDHAAKPDLHAGDPGAWGEDMARLAARPNLFCKLSGLVTEAGPDWSPDHLRPWIDWLLALFGPNRLLWGSDWPVLLPVARYDAWLATARALVPADAHAAVFGATARKAYRLA